MKNYLYLFKEQFKLEEQIIFENSHFIICTFKYPSGIEALKIQNSLGFIVVLPFYGQIIWDAEFKGHNLKMKNMFSQPKLGTTIVDTYGCFAFHSGLLCNGCPSPEDTHSLHGEMPCAQMDNSWLVIEENSCSIYSSIEYVKGFGHHYLAEPRVTLRADSSLFEINMQVTNLASVEMPLQYMCHMNYCYEDNATFKQNIPDDIIRIRESIPAHVKPTTQWKIFNEEIKAGKYKLTALDKNQLYDPEIVFFMDYLHKYQENLEFRMYSTNGYSYVTKFSSKDFDFATRWILYNQDQQVAAFVLPGTCRPEGFLAAKNNGTLIMLEPKEVRTFTVVTGIE